MHDGLFGFLKQIDSLFRLLQLLTSEKFFKQLSFNSESSSPEVMIML